MFRLGDGRRQNPADGRVRQLPVGSEQPEYQPDFVAESPLVYELTLGSKGVSYEIVEELLSQRRPGFKGPFKHIESHGEYIRYFETAQGKLLEPTWQHKTLETSLAQVPKMYREPEEFRSRGIVDLLSRAQR